MPNRRHFIAYPLLGAATLTMKFGQTAAEPAYATTETTTNKEGHTMSSLPIPPVERTGFDREKFEEFADMRIGHGDPIWWYGMGSVNRYPDGEPLVRVEGVDLGKLHRPDPSMPRVQMFTRKFIVFRDPKTNEILRDENGKARFIGYDYQFFTWHLEGDELLWEIEQGAGDRIVSLTGGDGAEYRKMGDLVVITTPVPVNSKVVQSWEKYDFLALPEGSTWPRFQSVWAKYTPNFSFMEKGFSTMHMWSYRYDAYESLPGSIRTVIENEPGMDLWRLPPMNLDEIRELQRSGGNYR